MTKLLAGIKDTLTEKVINKVTLDHEDAKVVYQGKEYLITMAAPAEDLPSIGVIHMDDSLDLMVYGLSPLEEQQPIEESPEEVSDTPQPETTQPVGEIDYKFNEGDFIKEFASYVDGTYSQHYSGKYQATDMIIDAGHGIGFTIGSIMKYARRLGKKGGYNRADVMKIMHYCLILLHVLEVEKKEER